MALADARAILPAVRAVDADPAGDDAALAKLAGWCGRYSPWVAVDRSDAAKTVGGDASIRMDITGCAHLFGGEAALLEDLTGRIAAFGFANRTAVADTPGAAWAVARFGPAPARWVALDREAVRPALEPLSVAALRLAPEDVAGLEALGLKRIGDLLPLPRATLAARFGNRIADRLDQALGRLPEPISPDLPPTSHFARIVFPDPVARIEDIAAALKSLLHRLCDGLEQSHQGARTLIFTLCEPDGAVRRLAVGVGRPSRDPDHLARLFAERLDTIESEFGFDALTLFAAVAETLGAAQTDLAGGGRAVPAEVDRLTDRLSNRLGAASVVRLVPHETHVPERAVRPVSVLDRDPGKRTDAWPHETPFDRIRPPRLLPRPEPVEAMAPIPDDPPVQFRWRRVTFRVVRADGPERITPEWWLENGDRGEDQRDRLRDYYRVEDISGRRFWLYREGLYRTDRRPTWFMHGVGG